MNTNRNLAISGAVLAGGLGFALYYLNKKKSSQQSTSGDTKEVCKELAVAILREINREMYVTYQNVAMIANQIKEQAGNRISNQELKEYLMHQNKQLKDEIKALTQRILEKNGLDEKDLKYACEVAFKDDKDIKNLMNESKAALENACTGHPPDSKTKLPDFLTPELTLTILEKIFKETLSRIRAHFIELKDRNVKLSFNNPEVIMGLHNLKLEDIRKEILKKNGLDDLEDPATKVFNYATQKYTMENPHDFAQKMITLEMQHQKVMESLMRDPHGAQQSIDNIGNHLRTSSSSSTNLSISETFSNRQNANKIVEEDLSSSVPPENLGKIKRQISVDFNTYLDAQKDKLPKDLLENLQKISNAYFEGDYEALFEKKNDIEEIQEEKDGEDENEAKLDNKLDNAAQSDKIESNNTENKEVENKVGDSSNAEN